MNKIKKVCSEHKTEIIIGGVVVGVVVGSVFWYKNAKYWYIRGFDLGQLTIVEFLKQCTDVTVPAEILTASEELMDKWKHLDKFMDFITNLKG